MKKYITIILLANALSGCQLTAEDEIMQADNFCTDSNWTEVGHKVAMAGMPVRQFSKYQEHCQNLKNEGKSAYLDGFSAGIKEYCTYERGFEVGESGAKNPNTCPLELRANYDIGFNKGHSTLKGSEDERRMLANLERQGQESVDDSSVTRR